MDTHGNTARKNARFGDYEIVATIGEGGMGIVYRALEPALGRHVAVKVLKDDLCGHQTLLARFEREGQAVASLNHPNIVHIYSVGAVEGIPYIAMEFVDGESLADILQRNDRMNHNQHMGWRQALHIAEQVAGALAAAHQGMIIHRDIKPGNILIDRTGKAYVTDFGIAKVLTAETQLTLDGARLGTPQYMSPERCTGNTVTASSDIYSLGILVFQLITGRLPYEGPTPVSLVQKIVSDPPARIRDFQPEVPEAVERLVAYMIEKNPKNRPPDAAYLVRTIQRVRAGKGLTEDPSGMEGALKGFRGSLPTPTPQPSPRAGKRLLPHTSRFDAFSSRWQRVSTRWRVAVACALVLAVGIFLGESGSAMLSRGYMLGIEPQSEADLRNWRQPPQVAAFENESPGVVITPINLSEFELTDAVWLNDGTLVAELRGADRSPRAGQASFVSVDLATRTASLAMLPIPSHGGRSYVRLLSASRGLTSDGFVFQFGDTNPELLSLRKRADERLVKPFLTMPTSTTHSPRHLDGFALKPDGVDAAMGISATGDPDSWILTEQSTQTRSLVELSSAGARIPWIEYSRDGVNVFFIRESDNGRSLWRSESGNAHGEARLVHRGRFEAYADALSGDGSSVIVTSHASTNRTVLQLLDSDTGAVISELGDGEKGAWHPSGTYVVAIAADLKGASQLWAIAAAPPHERRQLTFLNEGVAHALGVSRDGTHAFSNLTERDRPALVIADLPESF